MKLIFIFLLVGLTTYIQKRNKLSPDKLNAASISGKQVYLFFSLLVLWVTTCTRMLSPVAISKKPIR